MSLTYEQRAKSLFNQYPDEIKRFVPFMQQLCNSRKFIRKSPLTIIEDYLWKWHVEEIQTILNANTDILAKNDEEFANQLFYLLRACVTAHCLFNYIKKYQKSLSENFPLQVEVFFHDLKN